MPAMVSPAPRPDWSLSRTGSLLESRHYVGEGLRLSWVESRYSIKSLAYRQSANLGHSKRDVKGGDRDHLADG